MRCAALASRGAGRAGAGQTRNHLLSVPGLCSGEAGQPHSAFADNSAGRPVRTPHLRKRPLAEASLPRLGSGVFTRATAGAAHLDRTASALLFKSSNCGLLAVPDGMICRPIGWLCRSPLRSRRPKPAPIRGPPSLLLFDPAGGLLPPRPHVASGVARSPCQGWPARATPQGGSALTRASTAPGSDGRGGGPHATTRRGFNAFRAAPSGTMPSSR